MRTFSGMGNELLRAYLDDNGEGQTAFAARAGVASSSLSEWMHDKSAPDIYSAKLIEDATEGAVPIASWARADRRRKKTKPLKQAG